MKVLYRHQDGDGDTLTLYETGAVEISSRRLASIERGSISDLAARSRSVRMGRHAVLSPLGTSGHDLRRALEDTWLAHDDQTPANPKKAYGASKPDLAIIPPAAELHMAMAFEDGGHKYGPFNWREHPVEARTYIAAAKRHLGDFLDGADYAGDSEVHNLGHVMACCAILLDAYEQGNLIDNRPLPGKSAEVSERLKAQKAGWKEAGRKQWSEGSKYE